MLLAPHFFVSAPCPISPWRYPLCPSGSVQLAVTVSRLMNHIS